MMPIPITILRQLPWGSKGFVNQYRHAPELSHFCDVEEWSAQFSVATAMRQVAAHPTAEGTPHGPLGVLLGKLIAIMEDPVIEYALSDASCRSSCPGKFDKDPRGAGCPATFAV